MNVTRARAAPVSTAVTVKKAAAREDTKLVPWRNSSIVLRNSFSAISLNASAELTHNPYYGMTWSFRPWWWFTKKFYVRARLDVDQELTDSDITTYENEALVGDLQLITGLSKVLTIPKAEIAFSFDLALSFGTSKLSQSRTMVMSIGPGTRLTRTFKVLKGLTLGYGVRVTPFIHRYATSERETPLVPGCGVSSGGCDSQLNTGVRNAAVQLMHYGDVTLQMLSWLGVSLAAGQYIQWLRPLTDSPEDISLKLDEPENKRYTTFFDLSFTFSPLKSFGITLGYSSLHPQLNPNSKYYVPFFNRYSAVYLDLTLQIDGLVAAIKRSVK